MKPTILVLLSLLCLQSCTTSTHKKETAIKHAPYLGTWIHLTKHNEQYIIYQPCGMDNRLMQVSEQSIYELLPGEENKSDLGNITEEKTGYALNGKSGSHYLFQWIDKSKGIARWTIKRSASSPAEQLVFVDSLHAGKYKRVKEQGCEGEVSNHPGSISELLKPMLSEYSISQIVKGDANNDGIQDQLIILHHKSENDPQYYASIVNTTKEGVNRDAILFLGQPGGKFIMAVENKKLIPSRLFSGSDEQTSYELPSISKGIIQFTSIEEPRDSNTRLRKVNFQFKYNPESKTWVLNSAIVNSISDKDTAKTDTLTTAKIAYQNLIDFNTYNFTSMIISQSKKD